MFERLDWDRIGKVFLFINLTEVILMFVALLLGANLLPDAIATWYDATAVNGTLAAAPSGFIAIWNFVPYGVALAVFASFVMIGITKMKNMDMVDIPRIYINLTEVILMFVALLLGANLLPDAISTWYDATAGGGALEAAPSGFIAIWNFVPYGVALAVFASFVMIGIQKMKNAD